MTPCARRYLPGSCCQKVFTLDAGVSRAEAVHSRAKAAAAHMRQAVAGHGAHAPGLSYSRMWLSCRSSGAPSAGIRRLARRPRRATVPPRSSATWPTRTSSRARAARLITTSQRPSTMSAPASRAGRYGRAARAERRRGRLARRVPDLTLTQDSQISAPPSRTVNLGLQG